MIKDKSLFAKAEPADGVRVIITRFLPKNHQQIPFDFWCPELSPSADLLMAAKKKRIPPGHFVKRFAAELDGETAKRMLRILAKMYLSLSPANPDLTLLCYEKNGSKCHRWLVKRKLKRYVEELEALGYQQFDIVGGTE